MNEHKHPDLLDEELVRAEGLHMQLAQEVRSARCPSCKGREHIYWLESGLFAFECRYCGHVW